METYNAGPVGPTGGAQPGLEWCSGENVEPVVAHSQHAAYSQEKQGSPCPGYSDLEVVQPYAVPGLEVAGSDGSQVASPYDRPWLKLGHLHTASTGAPEAISATGADFHYGGGGNPLDPSAPSPSAQAKSNGRIWGLQRRKFWIMLALVLFCAMVALGVGIGVGMSVRNSDSNSPSPSSTSIVPVTPTLTGPSVSLPAAVATETATPETSIICPSANLTLLDVSASSSTTTSQKFLVLCGRDYNSKGGTVDLNSGVPMTTFAGCITACAQTDGCRAVGWGNYRGTPTCWLKSFLGLPNFDPTWFAAVLDDDG